jgi:hypothetical protein
LVAKLNISQTAVEIVLMRSGRQNLQVLFFRRLERNGGLSSGCLYIVFIELPRQFLLGELLKAWRKYLIVSL